MVFPTLKLKSERDGGPGTCSTKRDNFSTIGSLHQSFACTIFLGGICAVSVIITRQLISWYGDGSQNINFLQWSNATRFLTGNWIRDKVTWGNLPVEVWGEIGKRMVSQLDIAYFRSMCKGLRASLLSPTRFPLLMPPPPSCDPKFRDRPYTISEVTIYGYLPQCTYGSKAYMQVDQGGIFRLTTFLSLHGDEVDFYEASLLASPELVLSQLSFFAKAYIPCMALDSHKRRHQRRYNGFINKLVMISSSNAYGLNPSYAKASDLSVVGYFRGKWE